MAWNKITVPNVKRVVGYGAVFLLIAMMVAGAKDISSELFLKKPAHQQVYKECVNNWSEKIVMELPVQQRSSWKEIAAENPAFFIRACTVENRVHNMTKRAEND